MIKFLALNNETFGLDINDLSLKIVKLSKKRKGFVLDSFNEIKITPGIINEGLIENEDALAKIIKSACDTVKGKKLKTKCIVASLPEENSFLQVVQMPKMSEDEFKFAVPLEAENYIPMPTSDVYLDFKVLRPVKEYLNYSEVLIVAAPKKIVDSYVSCFRKANLIPLALEVESQAIARALIKGWGESALTPLSVLIDFGEDNADFIIFSGSSVRFTCSIPVSSKMLTAAVSESLDVGFHEAEKMKMKYGFDGQEDGKTSLRAQKVLQAMTPVMENFAAQIKKYLDFYQDHSSYEYVLNNQETEKIMFCGGGAQLRGLSKFMSQKLNIPVELGNPTVNLAPKSYNNIIIKENLPAYTTAIGLALRQAYDKQF